MHKRAAIIVFFMLVAGCAAAPPQDPAVLVATHGYVHVSLPMQGDLVVRSTLDSSKHGFDPSEATGDFAYGAWLPAGRYVPHSWGGRPLEGYEDFVVEAARITNLNALIPFDTGSYKTVLLPVRHPDVAADFAAATAGVADYMSTSVAITYFPNTVPTEFEPAYSDSGQGLIIDMILEHGKKVNKPSDVHSLQEAETVDEFLQIALQGQGPADREHATDGDGNSYFPARYGQVRVRSSAGSWSSLDTGTLAAVTAVEAADDTIFVGTAKGDLMSRRGDQDWVLVGTAPEGRKIFDIDHVDGAWMLVTGTMDKNINGVPEVHELVVYHGPRLDFEVLVETGRFPVEKIVRVIELGEGVFAGGAYWLATFPDLHRFDLQSSTWSVVELPKKVAVVTASDDGRAITAFRAAGMFSSMFVSGDGGSTWQRVKNPWVGTVHFTEPGVGSIVKPDCGAFTCILQVHDYDAGLDDYVLRTELPKDCKRIIGRLRMEELLCITGNNSILRHTEDGMRTEFIIN